MTVHDGSKRQDRATFDPALVTTVLCDLDGVIWLAHRPIAGSVEAVDRMRHSGRRVLFVTNNSMATEQAQLEALARLGIDARGDLVTSPMAAAVMVEPDDRAMVLGGPGVVEAVRSVGAEAVPADADAPGRIDVVVVGLDRRIDYRRLSAASDAVRRGARFVATNTDSTFPTPSGLVPGGGAIVAAVATAAGVEPVVAGKPHAPMAEVIARRVAGEGSFDPATTVMVGDRAETDGAFAQRLGCPFVLVRSGVLAPAAPVPVDVAVASDLPDLATLARVLADVPVART